MEIDHLLLLNFLPIIGTIVLIIVICITVVQQLKSRWPVKVNCWFCHKNTKIWREESDWWLCPSCEQYNGFSKDGDYMYDIPEQYNCYSNIFSKPYVKNHPQKFQNGLCAQCNAYETKKINALANFVAENEKKYDTEIEKYRVQLESQYSLCTNCQLNINNVLIKQSKWLMQYKMSIFKDKPVLQTNLCKEKCPFSRIVVIVINFLSVYYPMVWQLLIGGLLFQISIYKKRVGKWNSDTLSIIFWIYFISIQYDIISVYNPTFKINWFSSPVLPMISIMKTMIVLLNIKLKFCPLSFKPKVSFKKLENISKNTSFDQFTMNNVPIYDSFRAEIPKNSDKTFESNSSMQNFTNSISYCDSKSHTFMKKYPSEPTSGKNTSESLIRNHNLDHPSGTTNLLMNRSLMDSMNALNTLSLNDDVKGDVNTNHLDLFGQCGNSSKRCILASSKLKSVASSSWVAGGYWQKGMGVTSLSRSSSQSSGFGSVNSNFVPSREPSIRDIDKSSVNSDISQSHCNHNVNTTLSQTNPFFLSQSQDSVHNKFSLPQQTISKNFQCYENIIINQNLQEQNLNLKHNRFFNTKPLVFSFATVIMSPTWWPMLFGTSILLNVILLSTLFFH